MVMNGRLICEDRPLFFAPYSSIDIYTKKRFTVKFHYESLTLNLSGRRGSNSRPSAWKADALSTELLPRIKWAGTDSNRRRRKPTDLQSARFNHLPTYPCVNAMQRYNFFLKIPNYFDKKDLENLF